VPSGTSREHVATIPGRVRLFIESATQARFDRGHFANFGEFGPEFEFVYYVLDPGYNLYRDIQQRVNLKIMELFEELNVEFAVPARQVRISTSGADEAALPVAQS
jgi:small-conductance mechanosensitive channel